MKGEITQAQADRLVQQTAVDLAKNVSPAEVEGPDAWKFGDLLLAAREWPKAEKALRYAVAHAKNEDRRVNDSLRLAQVEAQLGNVSQAVALARSTFSASPNDKAPILPAVLLAIVPAGEGKGHDAELADLLEEAAAQHEQVVVDANTIPGRIFLLARPKHIRNAFLKAAELYEKAGNSAKATEARQRAQLT